MTPAPDAHRLLEMWEAALAAPPRHRCAVLLDVIGGASTIHDNALAAQDARLLRLRAEAFGSRLVARHSCAGCEADVAVEFDTGPLLTDPSATSDEIELEIEDWRVRLRAPTPRDLDALPDDPAEARLLLLDRCLLKLEKRGEPRRARDLSASAVQVIEDRLSRLDLCADIELVGACECGERFHLILDPAFFFWIELDAWARRTLREVADLARRFGWPERDILAMSARRRRFYLEMAS